MKALSPQDVEIRLQKLPHWSTDGKTIHRLFTFKDFREAFGFMTRAAFIAEEMNHHPDWTNVYNRVEIKLWTHDSQGITEKDFALAEAISQLEQQIR